jgi:hypothetical protein
MSRHASPPRDSSRSDLTTKLASHAPVRHSTSCTRSPSSLVVNTVLPTRAALCATTLLAAETIVRQLR